jgi:hypothetical protein
MSFLEMTKLHMARQENTKPRIAVRFLDGCLVKRIVWETETAIVFQDSAGHFWRYCCCRRKSEPIVIVAAAKMPLTPSLRACH